MIRLFKALLLCLLFILLVPITIIFDMALWLFEDFELTNMLKDVTIDKAFQ